MRGFGHAAAKRCKVERRRWNPEVYGHLMASVPSDGRTAKGLNHGDGVQVPIKDGKALAREGRVLGAGWMEEGERTSFVAFADMIVAMPAFRVTDLLVVTAVKRRSPGEPCPTLDEVVRDAGDELLDERHPCVDREGSMRGDHDDEALRAFRGVMHDAMALLPPRPDGHSLTVDWRMTADERNFLVFGERNVHGFGGGDAPPGWFRAIAEAAASEVGPRTGMRSAVDPKPYSALGDPRHGWDRLASSWTPGRHRTWVRWEQPESAVLAVAARRDAGARLAAWAAGRGLAFDAGTAP